jgi:hypothetical protein
MNIFGKIVYRRHNRVGVVTTAGRVYYVIDMDVANCPYDRGEEIEAEIIDEHLSTVRIISAVKKKKRK